MEVMTTSVDEVSTGDRVQDDAMAVDEAIALADRLLREALANSTRRERRQLHRLGRLVADPAGREMVQRLTDEVLRIPSNRRAARRFADVVDEHGLPGSLSRVDRLLLSAGAKLAPALPQVVMPLVRRRILSETKGVVLPAEDPPFAEHAALRRREGIGLLVNPLGESILGDDEARRRVDQVLEKLRRPDVHAVSIKASALVANLDVLDFDRSVERICEPMREIYSAALAKEPRGFVNLDMEEYRDLQLTVAAFTTVLDEPEFHHLEAGIVLQAYLPDSHGVLEHLGQWASARVRQGGAGIKIRIVKGANLAMEAVDAELHDWIAAPYPTKADVDASYKLMLESALRPEWNGALRVGVASHNLFDVAWALGAARPPPGRAASPHRTGDARRHGARHRAEPFARWPVHCCSTHPLCSTTRSTPASPTSPDGWTRTPRRRTSCGRCSRSRRARPSSPRRPRGSVAPSPMRHHISTERRRAPRRRTARRSATSPTAIQPILINVGACRPRSSHRQLARNPRSSSHVAAIDEVVATAVSRTAAMVGCGRSETTAGACRRCRSLRRERFDTIQVMADEAVKVAREGDPEVSEAIDFAKYYGSVGLDVLEQQRAEGAELSPRGVVVVASPWNFPYAIPAGGVLAALAAGNCRRS